jgi:phosphotransferase system HPr (HPr) family protein
MIRKTVKIANELGLHARPAAIFVKACSKYRSDVFLEKSDFKVNAKSIMGIMAMGISEGDEIDIIIDGPDEETAMKEILELLNSTEDSM